MSPSKRAFKNISPGAYFRNFTIFDTLAVNFSKGIFLDEMLYQPVNAVLNWKIMHLNISWKIVVVLQFQTQFFCLEIGWNSKAAFNVHCVTQPSKLKFLLGHHLATNNLLVQGDFFKNQIAGLKILGTMATKIVATWRVVTCLLCKSGGEGWVLEKLDLTLCGQAQKSTKALSQRIHFSLKTDIFFSGMHIRWKWSQKTHLFNNGHPIGDFWNCPLFIYVWRDENRGF